MQAAEKVFRNFGSMIKDLTLNGWRLKNVNDKETIMYLAAKYCSKSLRTLKMIAFNMNFSTGRIFYNWRFWGLIKLELDNCRQMDHSFSHYMSLFGCQHIQVTSSSSRIVWMEHKWKNTHTLILDDIDVQDVYFYRFIQLNEDLKTLSVNGTNLPSYVFQMVAEYLPKLEVFHCGDDHSDDETVDEDVLYLAELKSLKAVSLNCKSFSIKPLVDKFVKKATPIERLGIKNGTVDMELLIKLTQLKSMKKLQLERVKMVGVSLIDLTKQLPMLNELEIDIDGIGVSDIIRMLPFATNLCTLTIGSVKSNVRMNIDDYKSIVRIVKNRGNATKLCITITSESRQVLVPKSVLQENQYWLYIENKIQVNRADTDSESDDSDSDLESESGFSTQSDSSYADRDDNSDVYWY